MTNPRNPLFKKTLLLGILPFILLLLITLGEIGMRIFVPSPPPPYDNKEVDQILGWKPKAYYHYTNNHFPDNKGGNYPISIRFSRGGFRKWSNVAPTATNEKIFFLGDSYIESLEAADENLFYSRIEDSLPVSIFAFGSAGYGTTQEFLLLQQFIDSIKPNRVILEVCANDFADNYWELEKVTGYKVGKRRPYMVNDNTIEYHHPHYWLEDLKPYSLFLHFIFTKSRNALYKLHLLSPAASGDKSIAEKNLDYDLLAKAYDFTERTLVKMDSLVTARGAKLSVFIADDFEPALTDLTKLCADNHIELIEGISKAVTMEENSGRTLRAYDGFHWNNEGQGVVAKEFIKYFRNTENL